MDFFISNDGVWCSYSEIAEQYYIVIWFYGYEKFFFSEMLNIYYLNIVEVHFLFIM